MDRDTENDTFVDAAAGPPTSGAQVELVESETGWKEYTGSDSRNPSTESRNLSTDEKRSTEEKPKSGKWYPGKYMGRSRPVAKEEETTRDSQYDDPEWSKQDKEDTKQEAMIVKTVKAIRAKFLQRQLVGRIYIYRLSGVISTAITSDVSREDIMEYLLKKVETSRESILQDDPVQQAELEGKYWRALTTTDTILNSLERRSLSWEGADFAHTTLLTRGSTVGVSDPIIGLIGFSFTIELSATAHSLLSSRKRYEATRELAKCSKNDPLDLGNA